jgi:two-component sensor histidine kinase
VDFDELIGRQFRLSAEVASPSQHIRTERSGLFGELPSDLATPLALVINELVTNAVEHGLEGRAGTVWLLADRSTGEAGDELLTVTIADDGLGLPDGSYAEGLGLQIVRTLVTSELGGSIQWRPRDGGGTAVEIILSLARS